MRFDAGFHHGPTPGPALAYANTGCPRISIGERQPASVRARV
jgi:hypothetical protein